MSQSSPEGIILSKGSQLVSMELSINKEKILSAKQEKLYSKEDVDKLLENNMYSHAGDELIEQIKKE